MRLGECAFEFDVVEALADPARSDDRDVLTRALREALAPAPPPEVRFAMRPPGVRVFTTTVQAGSAGVRREAGILGFDPEERDEVRVDAFGDDPGSGALATLVRAATRESLAEVCAAVGIDRFEVVAGLWVVGELYRSRPMTNGPALVLGVHETAMELALFDGVHWRAGVAAHDPRVGLREPSVDGLTALLGCAGRRPPSARYGSVVPRRGVLADTDPLEPLDLVLYDASGIDPATETSLFAAAIGAAIGADP